MGFSIIFDNTLFSFMQAMKHVKLYPLACFTQWNRKFIHVQRINAHAKYFSMHKWQLNLNSMCWWKKFWKTCFIINPSVTLVLLHSTHLIECEHLWSLNCRNNFLANFNCFCFWCFRHHCRHFELIYSVWYLNYDIIYEYFDYRKCTLE